MIQNSRNDAIYKGWVDKTPDEILADVNYLITHHYNCRCVPDSILLPWSYVKRRNAVLPGLWESFFGVAYKLVKLRKQRRPRFARGFRV